MQLSIWKTNMTHAQLKSLVKPVNAWSKTQGRKAAQQQKHYAVNWESPRTTTVSWGNNRTHTGKTVNFQFVLGFLANIRRWKIIYPLRYIRKYLFPVRHAFSTFSPFKFTRIQLLISTDTDTRGNRLTPQRSTDSADYHWLFSNIHTLHHVLLFEMW